ncbi:WD40-repeat-containing domain protein [Syncephalis plumigaleata]|nr:WD40-repeat-containing domain protein [Syncephalis plumigaleata]
MSREIQPSYRLSNATLRQHHAVILNYNTQRSRGRFHMFPAPVYTGQFLAMDMKIRLFDSRNPADPLKPTHVIHAQRGNWTLSDVTLSRNQQQLAYSSLLPHAYYVNLNAEDPDDEQTVLDFSGRNRYGFCIWSLRFSGDGHEVIAGTSDDSICVYDLEKREVIIRQTGHRDHVNTVCYADELVPHVIYSGSDDTLINVWTYRGITHITSKGDGRYCLSNGKDQAMKLWDVRKMMSQSDVEGLTRTDYRSGWDYRHHPHDRSIQTFRGHRVTRTLIRCYFSPAFSTGQQYVYTGSSDGRIRIYYLNGELHSTIKMANLSISPHDDEYSMARLARAENSPSVIRDVSWHPYLPFMAGTTWNESHRYQGTVEMNEIKGVNKGTISTERQVEATTSADVDDEQDDEYSHDDDDSIDIDIDLIRGGLHYVFDEYSTDDDDDEDAIDYDDVDDDYDEEEYL